MICGQVQVTDRQDELVKQEEPVMEYAGAGTKPQEEPVEEIPQIPLPSDMANGYEEMLTTYPKLPLFAGSQIVDGVKIAPQDIGKLDMANWKLGVNSFLAHGYYKYQYLMLGKVKMNKAELHVIGVPGNLHEQRTVSGEYVWIPCVYSGAENEDSDREFWLLGI